MPADNFTRESITAIRRWTPKLFSLSLTRSPGFRFTSGQFARLGVETDAGTVWRAYSMVSSSHDEGLEFFSIVVPGGAFTSRLSGLEPGDTVLVGKQSFGFLTLDRFPDGEHLWLLATGTGIAPFLSILGDLEVWRRFERIVLVYSAREAAELAYQDEIAALRRHPVFGDDATKKLCYLPVVTREQVAGTLSRRVTDMLTDGSLEAAAGLSIEPARSRLMICGNPQMVEDTRGILQGRGLALSRLTAPAQLAVEQFW
jgi:ferredoxin/flavodoxin---NADP+ reductase